MNWEEYRRLDGKSLFLLASVWDSPGQPLRTLEGIMPEQPINVNG